MSNDRIIKIQISNSRYDFEGYYKIKRVLVYNKNYSWFYEQELTKQIKKIMGKSLKKFFYAKYSKRTKMIVIGKVAPYQNW